MVNIYREVSNGVFQIWTGEAIDDIQYPTNIDVLWSNTELNAIGLYIPYDPGVPDGYSVANTSVHRVGDTVRYVYSLVADPEETPLDHPLSARQIRLGLIRNGYSLNFVQSIIDAIPDQQQREEAQVWWEFSTYVHWDHEMTQALLTLAGINQEDAITMWMEAKDYAA